MSPCLCASLYIGTNRCVSYPWSSRAESISVFGSSSSISLISTGRDRSSHGATFGSLACNSEPSKMSSASDLSGAESGYSTPASTSPNDTDILNLHQQLAPLQLLRLQLRRANRAAGLLTAHPNQTNNPLAAPAPTPVTPRSRPSSFAGSADLRSVDSSDESESSEYAVCRDGEFNPLLDGGRRSFCWS
jgi:hypothetical protein